MVTWIEFHLPFISLVSTIRVSEWDQEAPLIKRASLTHLLTQMVLPIWFRLLVGRNNHFLSVAIVDNRVSKIAERPGKFSREEHLFSR
jgi:hypothetical protein